MNNVNVDFEIEDSTKRFLISERKSIINIESVENSYRINFEKNDINETFNKFRYDNVDKHDKNCVYVLAIVIL